MKTGFQKTPDKCLPRVLLALAAPSCFWPTALAKNMICPVPAFVCNLPRGLRVLDQAVSRFSCCL
ncbi:hypothetical protein [Bacillus atrophaeus]|uniref:hypothetical protein n=1 Tax=Bacillus atrophaeus TaxID=1452 RepID=UPI00227F6015|nr:hypothetical protein [Bacillus atrophaeus]MCY8990072.1 hypothetical protein [Bacillus atrophaeus]